MNSSHIKPTDKPVKRYYETLDLLRAQNAVNELQLRRAFSDLLSSTASRARGWTLVEEQADTSAGRRNIPDGTIRDKFLMRHGCWEAKDSRDDLDVEIKRKLKQGYDSSNIIFEDTIRAVLIQNGQRWAEADLSKPSELAQLLNHFFAYTKPVYESFEKAVENFKARVPELAEDLKKLIAEAQVSNKAFKLAFVSFFDLCKVSLNPNIRLEAVEEMLIQHLLTERLFRTIFDNQDFTRRNAVAAEVEKVIAALTSKSFSREEYQRGLDIYYVAIEDAARTIPDFQDKLFFLNTVYEQFFQGYSTKTADTHGIVYTPKPIVDFMCASVVEVLREEFDKELGEEGVEVLDPCTGTGSFIVNLLERVSGRYLEDFYKERLFANEVMLLPYYIAALNIEHAYYHLKDLYEPFEGLCFVDTLDDGNGKQRDIFITEANTQRILRQRKAPITVVIGNPPYNAHQINENDNNKNRKYPDVEKKISATYVKDSKATNKNAVWDAYVKFFRWATDRLENRAGIVCFVSNNSFVTDIAFDGFRKHILKDFSRVYHLNLFGNARKGNQGGSVFNIMVGVGITVAVRLPKHEKSKILYAEVPAELRGDEKLKRVSNLISLSNVDWRELPPDKRFGWILPQNESLFERGVPIGRKEIRAKGLRDGRVMFLNYGRGVVTCRDEVVYGFQREPLEHRAKSFISDYNSSLDRYKRETKDTNPKSIDVDMFCEQFPSVKWSELLKNTLRRELSLDYDKRSICQALYRPFTTQYLYFNSSLIERRYQMPKMFPLLFVQGENRAITVSGLGNDLFVAHITNQVTDLKCATAANGGNQCFPFYVYSEDGSNRRENITDWSLAEFRKHYSDNSIEKWGIFYYTYGLLHHPGYRETFAENLKRDLPRIPFAPDFRAFEKAGRELARLHLEYESLEEWPLQWVETPKEKQSYRVEKMKIVPKYGRHMSAVPGIPNGSYSVIVNNWLTLRGISPEVFEYRLGNRSALEWVLDQYRVKKNEKAEIVSDPNREDDEKYIVRLIGQVVRVSIETVRIVKGLPEKWME